MTSNSLSEMSEELSRETRKLEVRLDNFLKDEEAFVKELRRCIEKLKGLSDCIEKFKTKSDPKRVEEVMKSRIETIKALSDVLKKESKAEHEKSHLLESYGTLILVLEEFKSIKN